MLDLSSPSSEARVSADEFRHAFRHHPAGVAIITADAGDGPVAMTVSSIASVEIDPPTLVVSAPSRSSSTPTIRRAETVVVHLLTSHEVDLAKLGARSGIDRFGPDVEWARLSTGEPYYPGAGTWLRGRIVERVEVHGSTLVIVEAIEAGPVADAAASDPRPLVYHNRNWFVLGEKSMLPATTVPLFTVYGRDE